MNKTKLTTFAHEYLNEGISILPIKTDKRPVVKWSKYQKEKPTEEEINNWPHTGTGGLAWIMGEVSGNMEALDFDFKHGFTVEMYKEFEDLVEENYPGLGSKVLRQKTPTGGRHWIYRCEVIEGNQKLAIGTDGEAMIETRGEGGYICVGPTQGYGFQNVNGGGIQINEISVSERDCLMAIAKSFSAEPVPEKKRSGKGGKFDRKEVPTFPMAFIHFNEDHNISDLVEEDGWEYLDEGEDGKGKVIHRYQRDGGDGVGASLYPDNNTFYVFTTASELPTQQMMSPAEYIMYRDFKGDEKAMLEWLAEQGYEGDEERDNFDDRVKLRLKKDLKVKRFTLDLIDSIKAVAKIRYNTVRQAFEMYYGQREAEWLDPWDGLDSKAVHSKLMKQGVKIPLATIQSVMSDLNNWEAVDPLKEYLNGLIWDKTPRISDLANHVKCKEQKRWRNNFKKHLVRCVRQLLLQGVNRYALILHSDAQGNGKSTFIRYIISPGPMKYYYGEDLPKEGSEFGVARFVSMTAHANIEELDGFAKKDADHLKALTTRKDAMMRRMRTDNMFTVPRRVNFWGSTNKASFLTDSKNTRWIINEVESIDWSYTDIDIDQVWAEAVVLYKGGFDCDLNKEEVEANEEATKPFKRENLSWDVVSEIFQPCDEADDDAIYLQAQDVQYDLMLYYADHTAIHKGIEKMNVSTIGSIMRELNFASKSFRIRGVGPRKGIVVRPTTLFKDSKVFSESKAYQRAEVD
jgi:hypothetical protein